MIYVTGDIHREFVRVEAFCEHMKTTKDDTLVILGDVAINYYGGAEDLALKRHLSQLPITLFCVYGNHENRPCNIPSYKPVKKFGGLVDVEHDFPSLLFARDGYIYTLGGKRCVVIGGAYSVDKFYRIQQGWHWWSDEQPSAQRKRTIEGRLQESRWKIDIILSHTCPYKYVPREMFLVGIDQEKVDDSTERWLDTIENRLDYQEWYCGHWHVNKNIDKMRFLFDGFETID